MGGMFDNRGGLDTAIKRLQKMTGLEIYGSSSQRKDSISYGYAHIEIPRSGGARGTRETSVGKEIAFQNREWEDYDRKKHGNFHDWMADILKTGRTVGCGQGVGMDDIYDQPTGATTSYWMSDFPDYVDGKARRTEEEPWNLNPDYQRGHVWTQEQAEKFMGHMLEGGDVPKIFVQRWDSPDNAPADHKHDYYDLPAEVIDGQQRVRAICDWVKGNISAELADGRKIWFKDCNEIERRRLPQVRITWVDISREERLRFYLKLNRGGTIHTEEEIQKVRDMLAEETV